MAPHGKLSLKKAQMLRKTLQPITENDSNATQSNKSIVFQYSVELHTKCNNYVVM